MSVHNDRRCSCFSASPREALNPETLRQDKLASRLNFPSRVHCGVMDGSEHTSGEPGRAVFQEGWKAEESLNEQLSFLKGEMD